MSSNFDDMVKITKESLSVIQMIEHSGCAPLESGAFYRTFNDSLVIVTLIQRNVEVHVEMPEILKDLMPESFQKIIDQRAQEAEEEARIWRATVIEGGHGISDIVGELPGESYVLDDKSRFDLGGKMKRYTQALSMSLRKKVCHYKNIKELQIGMVNG